MIFERGTQYAVIQIVDHGLGIPQDQSGRLSPKLQRVRTDQPC